MPAPPIPPSGAGAVFSATSQPVSVVGWAHHPTALATRGGPSPPLATKPPPHSKWRPGGDGGVTPLENCVHWPPFLKRALVAACLAASAFSKGEPLRLGIQGNKWSSTKNSPKLTLQGCDSGGPGRSQQCRNCKDLPCFHRRTKIRRVSLYTE